MREKKWHSSAAWFYYVAGLLYYVYNWIFVTGAVSFFTSIYVFFFPHYFPYNVTYLAEYSCVIVVCCLILLVWGIILWLRSGKLQLQSFNPDIKVLSLERTYSVFENQKYEYSGRLVIRALRKRVESYKAPFRWSGKGKMDWQIANKKQHLAIQRDNTHSFDKCVITLERPLQKREECSINYSLNLEDIGRTARPYLSHDTRDRVDNLLLKVRICNNPHLQTYTRRILMSPISESPIQEEKHVLVDELGCKEAVWEIKRPRFGYCYQIIWE